MDDDGFLYIVSENGGGDFDHPQLWVYARRRRRIWRPRRSRSPTSRRDRREHRAPRCASRWRTSSSRRRTGDEHAERDRRGRGDLRSRQHGPLHQGGHGARFRDEDQLRVTVKVDDVTRGRHAGCDRELHAARHRCGQRDSRRRHLSISEVAAWSSGNSPFGADWFEITNTGSSADQHHRLEDGRRARTRSASRGGAERDHQHRAGRVGDLHRDRRPARRTSATFLTTWFGANAPAGLQIGSYSGGGVGLSTGGDAVNLFDAGGSAAVASVTFGVSPTGPFATFNNAAGSEQRGDHAAQRGRRERRVRGRRAMRHEIGSPGGSSAGCCSSPKSRRGPAATARSAPTGSR